MESLVVDQHRHACGIGHVALLLIAHQERWLAVVHTQTHTIGAEQGEQRNGNRTALDHAEHRGVEGTRGLQHDGHALASLHAARCQPVGEAARIGRQFREADDLVATGRVGHDQRVAARGGMAVHALMGDVERIAIAIEKLPQFLA